MLWVILWNVISLHIQIFSTLDDLGIIDLENNTKTGVKDELYYRFKI